MPSSPVDVDSTDIVKFSFTPMDPNGEEDIQVRSTVVGGAIPKEYIPAVGEGIEEAAVRYVGRISLCWYSC
jgi:hypothetical protein